MPLSERDSKSDQDRRAHRRYPVSVPLRYRISPPNGNAQAGSGRTINLSSGGVLFETEDTLPPQANIELSIAWPSRNEHQPRFELHVIGETVRIEEGRVAVRFNRPIFRTA